MADNETYYPPVAFYFSVLMDGEDAAFQEVSGISSEMSFEEIVSGGENRFKYKLPTVGTHQNLVLKRGLLTNGSKLQLWCADTINGSLSNKIVPQNISVSLLDATAKPIITWNFFKAYPIKYTVSDFHSQENKIVMESIELAYNYFTVQQQPPITQ